MGFWTVTVPQICRTEPAVWDAMIAISALFEHPSQSLDFALLRNSNAPERGLNQSQQDALAWYSRSISNIQSQIHSGSADPYVALVSCVLFICIETLQGRIEEALELFRQGVSLILDLRIQASLSCVSVSKTNLLEDTVIPLFVRLGTTSLAIAGVEASAVFALVETPLQPIFASLDSARSAIALLSAEAILFDREANQHLKAVGGDLAVSSEMLERQKALQTRLNDWHQAYINLCQSHYPDATSPADVESVLLAYYAASYVHVSGCLTQSESTYDTHREKFLMIVEQAVLHLNNLSGPKAIQPPFTFEMGIGLPLSLVALKCREPALRRKALGLLRQAPPMQGFFKCTPLVLLIENLMILEEGYALALRESTSPTVIGAPARDQQNEPAFMAGQRATETGSTLTTIPEEARICFYGVFRPSNGLPPSIKDEDFAGYNRGPNQLFLEIARNRYDELSGTCYPVHEVLPLDG